MLSAPPRKWYSWDFTLNDAEGRHVADVDLSSWRERGRVVLGAPYLVLSRAYWHSRFQDDPGVVGRTVQIFASRSARSGGRCCRRRWDAPSSCWLSARPPAWARGVLASRVLSFIVYEATPRDPLVLGGVVLAMSLLGLLATWIPAQRALSVDPAMLMRDE